MLIRERVIARKAAMLNLPCRCVVTWSLSVQYFRLPVRSHRHSFLRILPHCGSNFNINTTNKLKQFHYIAREAKCYWSQVTRQIWPESLPMSLTIPQRRRLAPAQAMNGGPHSLSSHAKHLHISTMSIEFDERARSGGGERQQGRRLPYSLNEPELSLFGERICLIHVQKHFL